MINRWFLSFSGRATRLKPCLLKVLIHRNFYKGFLRQGRESQNSTLSNPVSGISLYQRWGRRMNKLLAIIKREYVQRVRSRMFLFTTILGPMMLVVFAVVPSLIFNIKAGGDTRIAVVDQTGRLYDRVSSSVLKDEIETPPPAPSTDDVMLRKIGPEAKNSSIGALKEGAQVRFEVEPAPLQGDLTALKMLSTSELRTANWMVTS